MINIIGSTNPEGLKLTQGRNINFYSEVIAGKPSLLPTPGRTKWITLGIGDVRGWVEAEDLLYVVGGSTLYSVTKGGFKTALGSVSSSTGRIPMAWNGFSILLSDNGTMYATNAGTLQPVTDADAPKNVTDIVFMNGFYIVVDADTNRFYIGAQTYDAFTWNALDFAQSEANPDDLIRLFVDKDVLNAFNSLSLERFVNTGNVDFPFEPVKGAMSHFGIQSDDTISRVGANLCWLGRNENGGRVVYATGGAADPQVISDSAINRFLAGLDTIENAYSYSLTYKGHDWYCLTFPDYLDHGITIVFDLTTGQSHEWSTYTDTPENQGQFRAHRHVYFGDSHIVSDGNTLYKLTEPTKHSNIELSVAKDGRSYGNSRSKSLGNTGQYKRLIWRRLGDGRRWGFKFRTSSDEACDGEYRIIRERVLDAISDEDRNLRFNKCFLDVESGAQELVIRGGDIK